ncbi:MULTISPECIES: Ger(x)C family spore germination protein [Aneurinibacillus]|uniref:Ger(X)C family spore germination protein n=1 Tax=Aneurinibacillus thermoaerophilus TaxID=143495 RepID=A0A1G7XZA0_ANETH|nr:MULTISPECIES: Ger(x)C family spore germination protein [Aneurinibacillus]AMA72999.1 spore gernimation protein [Aneurinibacillus sp. XH2]MED0675948.1 Ger(x)C family spore germination protein [Aneurinibacillus thermoaerophilus]MED0677777.1 Ger(x)C family spore germination protein [Aneurinibacillus thermoaerophilus]MED0737526.1 Ger(x)C family spore germination protein [Aneurinibacillus thermoaerophilus]MED0762853.1 Ger(x)C family spore germination protein [Aneurinibacillus thermoaerophilus]
MRKRAKFIVVCLWLFFMSGCGDRLDVEDLTLSLAYGIDLDKDNELMVYQISPVFSKDTKKKYEVYGSKVNTVRQARERFNSTANGQIATGKVQVFLLGDKILKKEGSVPYLDVAYRDPKNTGNMRMVAVKGPVSSVLNSKFSDKPRFPVYINNVIDVANQSNETVFTTLQKFHKMFFDKGITPAISEIKADKTGIVVTGSALLNDRGMYKLSLTRRESALLLILQDEAKLPVSLTIRMPPGSFKTLNFRENVKGTNFVTINVNKINRRISTNYRKNHFSFDVKMKLDVTLVERTFHIDMENEKEKEQLTLLITDQLEKELNRLVKKVQKHHLDPFGFGWYARAYQYQQWKKIDTHWMDEFSRATVRVAPMIQIKAHGVIQ